MMLGLERVQAIVVPVRKLVEYFLAFTHGKSLALKIICEGGGPCRARGKGHYAPALRESSARAASLPSRPGVGVGASWRRHQPFADVLPLQTMFANSFQ